MSPLNSRQTPICDQIAARSDPTLGSATNGPSSADIARWLASDDQDTLPEVCETIAPIENQR
jgi:hypothetical protein